MILDLRYYSTSIAKLVLTEEISRVLIIGNMDNLCQSVIYGILGYGADEALAAYIKNNYPIRDIQVNGNSIKDYTIVHPDLDEYAKAAKLLHDAILERTGFDLKIEVSSEYDKYDRAIILSDTGLPVDGLVKISVENSNLCFRSTAPEGITGAVNTFFGYLHKEKAQEPSTSRQDISTPTWYIATSWSSCRSNNSSQARSTASRGRPIICFHP